MKYGSPGTAFPLYFARFFSRHIPLSDGETPREPVSSPFYSE